MGNEPAQDEPNREVMRLAIKNCFEKSLVASRKYRAAYAEALRKTGNEECIAVGAALEETGELFDTANYVHGLMMLSVVYYHGRDAAGFLDTVGRDACEAIGLEVVDPDVDDLSEPTDPPDPPSIP